jgi:hypothetical protein
MTKPKKMQVSLDLIDIKFERNVRERNVETFRDHAMQRSLSAVGQLVTAKLLKLPTGRFETIQGMKRAFNMKELQTAGIIDPKTAERNEDGSVKVDDTGKPVGGKVFNVIDAEVYEGISERERVELMNDHGTIKGLNKVELQYAAESMFDVGMTEKEASIALGYLLEHHYPATRKIKPIYDVLGADGSVIEKGDKGVDHGEYYRGVVQVFKDVYRSPTVVRDAYIRKLKEKLNWPLKKEIQEAAKIYLKEISNDNTGKLNQQNPGPLFNAYWDKVLKAHSTIDDDGNVIEDNSRGKTAAMMSRSEITDRLAVLGSRTLKAYSRIILRDQNIGLDQLKVLDTGCQRLEKGEITPAEYEDILAAVFNDNAPADKPAPGEGTPPSATTPEIK